MAALTLMSVLSVLVTAAPARRILQERSKAPSAIGRPPPSVEHASAPSISIPPPNGNRDGRGRLLSHPPAAGRKIQRHRARIRFLTLLREAIDVNVSQSVRINAELELSSLTETVKVAGGVQLVDTCSNALWRVVTGRELVDLPLNGPLAGFVEMPRTPLPKTDVAHARSSSGVAGVKIWSPIRVSSTAQRIRQRLPHAVWVEEW